MTMLADDLKTLSYDRLKDASYSRIYVVHRSCGLFVIN